MHRHSILIVDDEPNILSALRRSLAQEFDVRTAPGADAALEILAAEHVDAIITDHDMPGRTGAELLTIVRQRHPDVVRLMLSGKADLRMANDAVNDEMVYRFLVKPWEDSEVRLMIRLALRHREDQLRVKELSRLVADQAALFAKILEHHPDCQVLLERYLNDAALEPVLA